MVRLALGRHAAGDLVEGARREWLATTGFGDYAMGTTSGLATRRYHGLLVGAARPPIGRRMLVPFIDEEVLVAGERHSLATRRWADGSIDPDGHRAIAGFTLEDGVPAWTLEVGAARLERRIVMLRELRAAAVVWTLVDAPDAVDLEARLFVTHRGQHQVDPDATWLPSSSILDAGATRARIDLPANRCAADPTTLHVVAPGATLASSASWWRRHALAEERARGYESIDSACHALTARLALRPGESRTLVVGLSSGLARAEIEAESVVAAERTRRHGLLARAGMLAAAPELQSLCIAADAFIVRRTRRDGSDGRSIIAGYPWFEDWGRDAMIALPGLLLQTGRGDEAKLVLETFLEHLSGGLLPNRFPDESTEPEYHSADAPLLAIVAATEVARATRDDTWASRMLPALLSIVDAYERGTRHGIGIDADGLVRAGEEGLQLTWMDAKVGNEVVTPRRGKPVELSALWIEALAQLGDLLARRGRDDERALLERLGTLRARATASFARFWDPTLGCLVDVLDGPAGDERLIRPNQLLALALPNVPLDAELAAKARAKVASSLATPLAVRTLAPGSPAYRGRYEGDQRSRDQAYHNGTAWPFLAGLRLRAEAQADLERGLRLARMMLADLDGHLRDGGLGSVGEIADGDAPHDPRGCPMQAWSVGCILDGLATALDGGFRESWPGIG